MNIREVVFEVIKSSDKPLKVGDIERITGIDRNSIQKVVNEMNVKGIIELDKCYNKILGIRENHNG
jgi:Mn-dependent DtxR family transcriptional regulator